MKKNFEQPELMVVRVNNNVVTASLNFNSTPVGAAESADRMGRESWDAGY